MIQNEQKFYSAIQDVFIGEAGLKMEGKSGYVNLMKMKSQYFSKIKPFIEEAIQKQFKKDEELSELYQKLYSFFDTYLNETGTPFFSQTPFHKNLYEKVYNEREDVSLFWKTQRLYYVKSEATYSSISNLEINGVAFNFDASGIEHQKNNEKKELEFWLTDASLSHANFKVVYADNSKAKWERLKEYLNLDKPDEIRKHLAENYGKLKDARLRFVKSALPLDELKAKQVHDALLILNENDLTKSVSIERAISKLDDIESYIKAQKNYKLNTEIIKQAQSIYKKQHEVDYFIHKDAEAFLKEQFDLYIYNYLFNDTNLGNEWTQDRVQFIQKLKKVAHLVIEYIARFEDELKAIWTKPKFVRKVNYVFTLDRIADSPELIEKIVKHKNFKRQIEEYKHLETTWEDEYGDEIKKEWKEFSNAAKVKPENILLKGKKLNEEFKFLPIDTALFPDLKIEILSCINDLDKLLDGVLIKSENYQALITLLPKYYGQVEQIYIDPPFNTGNDFDYKDKFRTSTWLSLMEDRLFVARDFLKKEGTFFLHLDFNADYVGRILMDKIFGENNLTNEIVWYYDNKLPDTRKKRFTNSFDIIFSYGNSDKKIFNWLFTPREKPIKVSKMKKVDGKKIYLKDDEGAGIYEERTERTMDNVWKIPLLHAQPEKFNGFATQKSEELLYRIIKSGSNIIKNEKNTLVLDFYSGSATTISTVHKLNGKWIGIEMGEHFYGLNLPRLKRVLIGDQAGISNKSDVNWQGGAFLNTTS